MSLSRNLEEGTATGQVENSISENRLSEDTSRRMRIIRKILFISITTIMKTLANSMIIIGTSFISSICKLYSAKGPFGNSIFLISCMLSMLMDPLFFYTPVIHGDKKCFKMDITLAILAIIYRTYSDSMFLMNRLLEIQNHYSKSKTNPTSTILYDAKVISNILGKHITTILDDSKLVVIILCDTFMLLPLPQVLVILAACRSIGTRQFFFAMNFFLFQHVLKVIRLFTLFQKVKNSGNLAEWAKIAFNFCYFHAGHVFGAIWYFFAIERQTVCWRKACRNDVGCGHISFYCNSSPGNYIFSHDFCSTNTNSTTYDFGIFHDAINSGVVKANNYFQRVFPCFRWGIQTVSWFGQGLPFSANFNENLLAVTITISGVVVFFFLIGKVQSTTVDMQDRKRKLEGINRWQLFRKLPEELQEQVKYQSKKWRDTREVNVEYVVNNAFEVLGNQIKRKLCLNLLKKVREFRNWNDAWLEVLCDLAKPVFYGQRSYIVREGDPIDQILFVVQGEVWSYICHPITETSNNGHEISTRIPTQNNQIFGIELVSWAKNEESDHLPVSSRSVQGLTNVEAFVLMAKDLKKGLFLIPKRNWAARRIQSFWLSRKKAQRPLSVNHRRHRITGIKSTSITDLYP